MLLFALMHSLIIFIICSHYRQISTLYHLTTKTWLTLLKLYKRKHNFLNYTEEIYWKMTCQIWLRECMYTKNTLRFNSMMQHQYKQKLFSKNLCLKLWNFMLKTLLVYFYNFYVLLINDKRGQILGRYLQALCK